VTLKAVRKSLFKIALKSGLGYLRHLPLIFAAIHFGLGFGFFSRLMKNNV
jgi:hypothetical protein